jgi:hypothetical protein
MVNVPKQILSPLPAGKYGTSTSQSTCRHHPANESNRGSEAVWVRALGALRTLQNKNRLAVEQKHATHWLSNEDKVNWIEDYVEMETAVERQRVEDAETANMQELKDITAAECAGGRT